MTTTDDAAEVTIPVDVARSGRPVDPTLIRAASYSWRLLVIATALAGAIWLLGQMLIVVIPVALAILLTRALLPPTLWITERGVPRSLAAIVTLGGFVIALALLLTLVGASLSSELSQLGGTVSEGLDDVETWLVDDSPFDLDRARVEELRQQVTDRVGDALGSSTGTIASSAVLAVELIAGGLLSLVVTFFVIKDHDAIVALGARAVRRDRRPVLLAVGRRAWQTLGGYLRGVALLGVVEAVIIGAAVWLVGGELVVAVVIVTLLGAFVPIVGATLAGVVAVLATLVTAGTAPSLIVAVVAIAVQQLDGDLLAPVIYGRSLRLHPLVILLGVAAGGALFGLVGAVLAVPVISVTINGIDEARNPTIERTHDARTRSVDATAP